MYNVMGMIGIILSIVYLSTIFLGMYICRKYSFKEGFYFFVIIAILHGHSYFAPFYRSNIFDWYQANNISPPGGMSIGELAAAFSYIDRSISFIAFLILVIGLYRLFKK